jgi:hypothetical protein
VTKKVFISYSHAQGDWVRNRLVPCLEAGGTEVLIDHERFEAAKSLVGQMDSTQDAAEASVLLLSPEYLQSPNCCHEMERAIARDPHFQSGSVIPVKRVECKLPDAIQRPNPLHVDLRDDKDPVGWGLLLKACGADLGTVAPDWLKARDDMVEYLGRGQSVNVIVRGKVRWRPLINHVTNSFFKGFGIVNLDSGATVSREGLVTEILRACGLRTDVLRIPNDLGPFTRISERDALSRVALLHFDNIAHRNYGPDLFASLRHLVMDQRKLVLLIASRSPFETILSQARFLPSDYSSSRIDFKTVELIGPPS